MPTQLEKLVARVESVNRCHAVANAIWPQLVAALEPFVGKPVETKDGPLRANVQKVIDALELPDGKYDPETNCSIQVYRHAAMYNLAWTVKSCVNDNGRAYYHEATLYVADLDGCSLKGFCHKHGDWRTDYTVDAVVAARKAYALAKEAASTAYSALHPFGEYDQ